MKLAKTTEGESVRATEAAPAQATCPRCQGTVILRHRRLMGNEGVTYFWRHRSNRNSRCSARFHPYR